MSITDELRKWAKGPTLSSWTAEHLTAIADRIDAAHEDALVNSYFDGVFSDEELAENGFVRLPKDADGEYIHIGDVMEGVDKYDTLKEIRGKVITVSFESSGAIDVAIKVWSSDGKSWHRAYLDPDASVYRHHREQTVEDVLRDMLDAWGELPSNATNEAIVAEYAAKLRLAGEGE